MNTYFNILIKLMIFLVLLLLVTFGLYFANVTNLSFDDLKNEDTSTNVNKDSNEPPSREQINKINDSLEQRGERIKALKEVGKKLGG